ncbi:uncharacterized protein STEHIDRAFT_164249 [Stereum hirsutum FP-91666 SS1]|uniref:uncharacterized protein n=1 Tax=Stereum hirsutum (strain FP-91666) TaxID=721885 RepID=UPI000440DFF1|nr:uncharacterized protein STEHIDRAFT_164249 [Stereum hirsutum FP-91666 SS1]EIM91786.1 hypothetical protein STEHIDRAFT_164249 [Stereum hirsutum FP-91666 SS1]
MADIIKDRVYIPSAAFIFPITPGFVGQPVRISSPTPTGQGSTSTKKSRNAKIKDENKIREKLSGDDGCFLTGYACLSLEVAHLVNAVQKKGNKARLDKVIYYLVDVLGIVRKKAGFNLEAAENLVYLRPTYHRHLDLYATFAITLSEDSLKLVIQELKDVNEGWAAMTLHNEHRLTVRSFSWLRPGLYQPTYDIILLHPSFFLLPDQPLIALKQREPRVYGLWQVIDGELRQALDSDPYPPFSRTFRADSDDDVNPFLLILNAGSKLENHQKKFGLGALTGRQRKLADLTLEAYELIYYRPPMFTERLQMFGRTDFSTTPPLPTPAGTSGQSTAVSRQAHENDGTALGTEDGSDSMVEDGTEVDEMDEDDEESDSGSESDSEGLCAEEEDNILAKFADPATTLDERKELGALFLRGGRPYRPFPLVPGMPVPEERARFPVPLPFHHRPPLLTLLMADIIKDRVYIPSAASIFPNTPGFVGQPVRISSPTPTGQGSTSTKKSRNAKIKDENKIREKLSGDDGCFLTGYACLSLEVAHLVNAVQKKGNKARLDKVIYYLVDVLGIVRKKAGFNLEAAENLVYLRPTYHRHLDLYATFAITLSEDSLKLVIQELKDANAEWAERTRLEHGLSVRIFRWLRAGLYKPTYDIILLHPSFFLLPDQPLIALKQREPRVYGLWQVIDGELRQALDSDPYPPFSRTFRADSDDDVNPFLLILNAGSKLENHQKKFGLSALTGRQRKLADLSLEAYELIYYRPPMFTERLQMFGRTDFSTTPPLPTPAGTSGQSTAVSRQAHENGGTALGTEDGSDSMVEDGMEADEMDEDDEESDSGSESDSEGLCAEEEDNILAKFADPATTLDERKELGALFLRGGRPYLPFPLVPGMPVPEERSLFEGRGEGS